MRFPFNRNCATQCSVSLAAVVVVSFLLTLFFAVYFGRFAYVLQVGTVTKWHTNTHTHTRTDLVEWFGRDDNNNANAYTKHTLFALSLSLSLCLMVIMGLITLTHRNLIDQVACTHIAIVIGDCFSVELCVHSTVKIVIDCL